MGISPGFGIAASALSAFRVAAEVAGHNMTNVNTEGYSRQRAIFRTNLPQEFAFGPKGTGVNLATINRMRDSYLDRRLEQENSEMGMWSMREDILQQIELYFNETTEAGVSNLMAELFEGWQALASSPDDQATRVGLVQQASLFTTTLNKKYEQIQEVRESLDVELQNEVDLINSISQEIASLNTQIVSVESGGHTANDMRDRRDTLVGELSEIIDIQLYEQNDGSYSISYENKNLVFAGMATEMEVYLDDSHPQHLLGIRWEDTKQELSFDSGKLGGLFYVRDVSAAGYQSKLDTLAQTIIEEVNRIHASGQGIAMFTSVTGATTLDSITDTLDSSAAGLDITPVAGSFDIIIDGDPGSPYTVNVDPSVESLEDLRDNINTVLAATDVSASIVDNQLVFSTAGDEFAFSNDSSDILMSLGINTFFTGYGASDIAVNPILESNASYIAAAQSSSPGDNTNAMAIAALRNATTMQGNSETFEEFYNANIIGELGTETSEATRLVANQQIIIDQIQNSIDEVSSVSLDEEMTNLVQIQQATTAIARYISMLSDMLEDVVTILR